MQFIYEAFKGKVAVVPEFFDVAQGQQWYDLCEVFYCDDELLSSERLMAEAESDQL